MVNQILFTVLITLWVFIFTGCKPNQPAPLTIAAAANLQYAIKEIADAFEHETGNKSDLITSSSGKLTAQIKQGAPFDLFLSADLKYPEELYKDGLAASPVEVYAYGSLVLWSMNEDNLGLNKLKNKHIKHIAIANPETAPYGRAAIEVLEYNGLYDGIKDKLVYAENISQTSQFITSQNAEIGFTAKSIVLVSGKGHWIELAQNSYSSIEQSLVVLKEQNPVVNEFINYLFSEKGRKILTRYGYQPAERIIE